jgi:hypothetical protein
LAPSDEFFGVAQSCGPIESSSESLADQLRDGWRMKLVDEDTRWYLSASRTKLRQDVHCNVVVADDVVELETIELVLELADF